METAGYLIIRERSHLCLTCTTFGGDQILVGNTRSNMSSLLIISHKPNQHTIWYMDFNVHRILWFFIKKTGISQLPNSSICRETRKIIKYH